MTATTQPYIRELDRVRGLAPSVRERFVSAWLALSAGGERPSAAAIARESGLSRVAAGRLARDPETLDAVREARGVEARRGDPAAAIA